MTQTYYRPIAVAGATGAQGGATVRALLRRGRPVRALTRTPDSAAAATLRRLGAEVVRADFADRSSLVPALAGAMALFAVTTPFGTDVDREVRDGFALLEAAAATGTVEHVVYTSAAHADRDTGVPHFDSKYRIERRLATLGVPWTVIAPAAFMDQYAQEWTLRGLRDGVFGRPMPADKPLALIAAADIGEFTALALTRPDEFVGRRIDLASDVRTGQEIAAILGAACGREIVYREFPVEYAEAYSADLAAMFRYFARAGLDVDAARLRRDYPEVGWHSLPVWAAGRSWDLG
ncbi:NmrA/HSCARG family protein [Planosporangium thailandense]|uniref:NmrA/HSCARG family protein n=1 Tax=Planosporangium thailandense TaxID=765197 RepID=A0ABX0XTV2_9ACTN|nr:NmrA/HSCARG family protein [Planosporangium thailandense]NJC69251.1 NmrA/HSCARG family protein [Planosporangium thailandense]